MASGHEEPRTDPHPALEPQQPADLPTRVVYALVLALGPVLLFLFSAAYGVLEVHSSTDTWIGLAGGRHIEESIAAGEGFPLEDTFAYTTEGRDWLNQNWLTHLWQWELYKISPNWVIYGTWVMAGSIFVFVGLATWWRCGHWLAAVLAAAVVGIGCRDFLSARPATTGFFAIAVFWALICAIEGQRDRRRWWPIALLLPLLVLWGHAHGSFVFGYGMLAIYLAHYVVMRFLWPGSLALTRPQALGVAIVMGAAFLITWVTSPFGFENFVHGQEVAESDIWRRVSEWNPPIADLQLKPGQRPNFPPMFRFWWMLGLTIIVLPLVFLAWLFVSSGSPFARGQGVGRTGARGSPRRTARDVDDPAAEGVGTEPAPRFRTTLFDLAAIAIGLTMTLWARRFAPIFYVFAAPIVATWLLAMFSSFSPAVRVVGRWAFVGLAYAGAITMGLITYRLAYRDLVEHFEGREHYSLLERVTRYDSVPHAAIRYLYENELRVNVLAQWTHAGPIMFFAPGARVYIDGRAQQVHTVDQYKRYQTLTYPETDPDMVERLLDGKTFRGEETGQPPTNAVLLPPRSRYSPLLHYVSRSPEWVPVLTGPQYGVYLRTGSDAMQRVAELVRTGREWRPDTPDSVASLGDVWFTLGRSQFPQAIGCWINAINRRIILGRTYYVPLVRLLLELGRVEDAARYVDEQLGRVGQLDSSDAQQREAQQQLVQALRQCQRLIQERRGGTDNP